MGTTIDSLQIEIQTSSSNAAGGIDSLAKSLERLKKVGSFNVVIKNLNNLSSALGKLQTSSSGLAQLNALASSIESLRKAGSLGSIGNGFAKLSTSLKDLEKINVDGVVAKIKELNKNLGIPETLDGICEEDIPVMAKHADKEGNPLYPVPVLMDKKELEKIYRKGMTK